jgi:hypothetical protein
LPVSLVYPLFQFSWTILCSGCIGIHYLKTIKVVSVYCSRRNRIQSSWNGFSKSFQGVLKVFSCVLLASTPVSLNKIQLAMELRIENDKLTSAL